jgi:hypothetical protein
MQEKRRERSFKQPPLRAQINFQISGGGTAFDQPPLSQFAQFFDMKRIGSAELAGSGAGRTARRAVRASCIPYLASQIAHLASLCSPRTTDGRTQMDEWTHAALRNNFARRGNYGVKSG